MDNVTRDEAEFMYYKSGRAGSFYTSLVDCFFRADGINQLRLLTAFPELEPVSRYSTEPGYWEDLQERWKKG
jgi:hypothetical protein